MTDSDGTGSFFGDCTGGGRDIVEFEVLPDMVGDVVVERLAGASRVGTATAISRALFSPTPTVFLARADDYADALAVAPLAYTKHAPVLLVPPDQLPRSVASALALLRPEEVVLLGGPGAISRTVAEQVARRYPVRRISEDDRYGTAVQIAQQRPADSRSAVYVALGEPGPDGQGFADALAAAPMAAQLGRPLLLVGRDFVPDRVRQFLELEARRQDVLVTIIGGEHAISAAVEQELRTLAAKVFRVAGATRYQTAALLYPSVRPPAARWLATGASYPDALAAGAAVPVSGGLAGGGLLLVDGEDIRAIPEVVEVLRRDRLALERVYVLGGPEAISEDAVAHLGEVLLTDDLDAPPCQPDRVNATFTALSADDGPLLSVDLRHQGPEECTLGGRPEVTLLDEDGEALPTSQQALAEPQLETSTVVPLVGTSSPAGGDDTGGAVFRVESASEEGCDEVVEAARLQVEFSASDVVTAVPIEAGTTILACRGEISVGFLRDSA